jgi:hypothetical protein
MTFTDQSLYYCLEVLCIFGAHKDVGNIIDIAKSVLSLDNQHEAVDVVANQ